MKKCDRCGKEDDNCLIILMSCSYRATKPDIPPLKDCVYIGKHITEKDEETLERGLRAGEGRVCRLLEDGSAVTVCSANQDGPFFTSFALRFLRLQSLRICWDCQGEWRRAQEEWFGNRVPKEDK